MDARRAPSGSARTVRSPTPSSRAATPARRSGSCASRRRAAARSTSINASTCIVLPRPMSSARHAPRPSDDKRCSQRTPACWYGRSVALSASPGSTRASASGRRSPSSVSASQGPATMRDQSGAAESTTPFAQDVRAGEHPHGFGERQAGGRGRLLNRSKLVEHARELLSIDLDPASANEVEAVGSGEQLSRSRPRSAARRRA